MTRAERESAWAQAVPGDDGRGQVPQLQLGCLDSPLGELLLVFNGEGVLYAVDFADCRAHLGRGLQAHYGYGAAPCVTDVPQPMGQAFQRYFAGQLDALAALPLASAGTALQRRVWAALCQIPAGTTTSYGRLARSLGFDDPHAAIEIGAANGANPFAIVVPCHRVVASDGQLKGYAWGLQRKRWLLEHECAIAPQTAALPGF